MISLLARQRCRSIKSCCLSSFSKSIVGSKLSNVKFLSSNADDFPTTAEVVIAGAGAVGSSVAYHLAKLGNNDVVVLEQGSLGCGTSWHSVGLVAKLRGNTLHSNMAKYSTELYANLGNETGYDTGFKKCGAILLAKTKDRATLLKRTVDKSRQFGVDCEILSPKEAQELYPIMKIDDIQMAAWSPDEGVTNASDVCQSLMKGATQKGVKFIEGVSVNNVATNGRRVVGVDTDRGFIKCEKFINCGGQWARDLGLQCDTPVNVPLHSCEHFYIVTKPMSGVYSMLPTLRDQDGLFYVREWSGGLMAGGFEPVAKPCFYEHGIPKNFEFQLLPEDWEHFEILMEHMVNRIPSLENAEIRQFVNGPESFSPDGKFFFGETPEVENYYVAAGMNSNGIMCAAGMGKITAELVTFGSCSWDTSIIDIKRLPPGLNNKLFLRDRVKEVLGRHYAVDYPKSSVSAARPLKCSPLFDLLDANGARWGEYSGWEVANYFADNGEDYPLTFGKPGWLKNVEQEYNACKRDVALADMSWQSKFEITINEDQKPIDVLQNIFAENIDIPVGRSLKTALLSEGGKYKGVVDIHRITDKKFLLVCGPAQHNHILPCLRRHFGDLKSIKMDDVTSKYSTVCILGPASENTLRELTRSSLKIADFGVGECKVIDLGYASGVILSRGFLNDENNWQAYIPSEFTRNVFQMIRNEGTKRNIKLIGQFTLDSLRIEAGIPEYGIDISPSTPPADLGNMSFVDIKKSSNFIGKEALYQNITNCDKTLMKLCIDEINDDNWAWGSEPVFADDKIAGSLTSVSYCFGKGRLVGLGIFDRKQIADSKSLSVQIAGKRYPASLQSIGH